MTTVLVVEDNPPLGKMLVTSLGAAGHQAVWVSSGAEALTQAAERSPSVVLIDLHLGDMDGADLAAELRKRLERARLIGLSGEVPRALTTAAFDSFLLKPVSLRALLRCLHV